MKTIKLLSLSIVILLHCAFASDTSPNKRAITYSLGHGDMHPLVYSKQGGCGGYQGLFVDILQEIFVNKMNMELTCKAFPWKRAQNHVEKGDLDFLITIPTESRLKYSIQSEEPVFPLYMQVFTYKDHPRLDEIKQIKTLEDILRLGLIPVTNFGNGWHKANVDSLGIPTVYLEEDEHILNFLAAKRADIIIDAAVNTSRLIKKLGYTSKIETTDVRFGPANFHLLMSKKSDHIELLPEINLAIKTLNEDGTLDELIEHYSK